MKHHIAVKFLAVALCAACLLTAVGSGLGILAMTTADLYEKSVDEVYDEAIQSLAESYAYHVAFRYASTALGGCPEEAVESHSSCFTWGRYGYILSDADGNVLDSLDISDDTNARYLSIPITFGQYQKLISLTPESELYAPTEAPTHTELFVIDNIPGDHIFVDEIYFYTNDGFDCNYADEALGVLSRSANGDVAFQAHDPDIRLPGDEPVTQVSFFCDNKLVYQIVCSDGVGTFALDENGLLSVVFQNPESTEATIPVAPPEPDYIYNAIPGDGAEVYSFTLAYLVMDGEERTIETHSSDEGLGRLYTTEDGTVVFIAGHPQGFPTGRGTVSFAAFYGMDGQLLYETYCAGGAGSVFNSEDNYIFNGGYVSFESWLEHYGVPNSATEPQTETPTEVPTEAPTITEEVSVYNAVPSEGAEVIRIFVTFENGDSESVGSTDSLGHIFPRNDGRISFLSNYGDLLNSYGPLLHVAFYDLNNNLLYEARSSQPVGEATLLDSGETHIVTWTSVQLSAETTGAAAETPTEAPLEATLPPVTEVVTATEPEPSAAVTEAPSDLALATTFPPEEEPSAAVTEVPVETAEELPDETAVADSASIIAEVTEPPMETAPVDIDVRTTHYWDNELQEYVQVTYTIEDLPEGLCLELWLLPGAYEMDAVYDLLQFAWTYRNELFYVLGISILLFAVFAVYLCCAAGRKPGTQEVRAEGFNCLPLDVYLGGGALAICALAALTVEGGYYLLRNSPHVIAQYILISGYLAALIIVGFCFACAAQFKTPGGYWWRNTLFVRAMAIFAKVMTWLEKFLRTGCFPLLGRGMKGLWGVSKRFAIGFYRYTEMFLGWLFRFTGRSAKFLWNHGSRLAVVSFHALESALTWLGRGLGKIAQRAYAWLHAFLALLPVTWQWLLVGLMLLFILAMAMLTRSEGFFTLAVLAGISLVVYGSHCFGILWDSTRNMSKGNLETKVDDKLMVGAFKDFAGDLNNLAGVAVIAAQKQMQSERMKTELITNVSHDIKTPLTSIINYVDLLQKPHTDDEQAQYLEVLARQSLRMKKLLEDLMEMSKASTGNMSVNVTRLNAAETVTQALGEFADKLAQARLTPMVQQPETDVYMQADGRLAWRVLSNLLGNAVKYALPGTRVYIDVMELDGQVLISLKNISREPLNISAEELMERFVRGDASRNTEGSGLGLNIAQSLMEIQHGRLDLVVDGDLFKVTLSFPKSE